VGGVIKMVMALRNGVLPPTLHAEKPSPHVDWTAGAVELLTEPVPWPEGERPRRAGVSSFGISGTNAHLILEEAPREEEPPADAAVLPKGSIATAGQDSAVETVPWLVSAKSEAALREQAERLRAHVEADPELELLDVAFTLATARAQLDRRAAVVGSDRDALLAGLDALARGEPAAGVPRPPRRRRRRGHARGRQDGVHVHRPGRAAGRDGARALRGVPSIRGGVRRGVRGARRRPQGADVLGQ
jgi:acyl transferase domain-containing protein